MHIVVLSDSHGSYVNVERIIEKEHPDGFIFCGDGISDIFKICEKYPSLYCHIVSGNCDRIDNFPLYKDFDMAGKHFYVTHGHMECVKGGYMTLAARALTFESDIVVYGHTHVQMHETFCDMHLLNPGSAREGNYGVIDISENNGKIDIILKNIKG